MARYVVIYFEDNEEAERMIEEFTDNISGKINDVVLDTVVLDGEVVAFIPAPTLFCDCLSGKKTELAYSLGQKYNWWVCRSCGRPSRRWGESYRAIVGAAKNLLDEETVRPPPGWDQEKGLGTA